MNRFGHSQTPRGRALYRTKAEAEAAGLESSRKVVTAEIALRKIAELTERQSLPLTAEINAVCREALAALRRADSRTNQGDQNGKA